MTPCSFVWWLDDFFQPKRSGIICYERRDIIRHQLPNLAPWENSRSEYSIVTLIFELSLMYW